MKFRLVEGVDEDFPLNEIPILEVKNATKRILGRKQDISYNRGGQGNKFKNELAFIKYNLNGSTDYFAHHGDPYNNKSKIYFVPKEFHTSFHEYVSGLIEYQFNKEKVSDKELNFIADIKQAISALEKLKKNKRCETSLNKQIRFLSDTLMNKLPKNSVDTYKKINSNKSVIFTTLIQKVKNGQLKNNKFNEFSKFIYDEDDLLSNGYDPSIDYTNPKNSVDYADDGLGE